jgi:ribosomal protein L18E
MGITKTWRKLLLKRLFRCNTKPKGFTEQLRIYSSSDSAAIWKKVQDKLDRERQNA